MSFNTAITVSQLNSYIKSVFDADRNLKNIFVKGEISNYRNNFQSEHRYFSLKDGGGVIKAVMFSGSAKRIRFDIQDGMKVLVRGSVSSYETSGQYQIYVEDIQPDGLGSIYLEIEQLKKKLSSEGLFDQERKKALPEYPSAVGVITSASGSVIHDINNVISRRYPVCRIMLHAVKVQGEGSAEQISEALAYMNHSSLCDVIILARGGGSAEELWAFNNEKVARAISKSNIPVISAVGHETDFTICDLVSDMRAPTPSAAAEIVVPNKEEIIGFINSLKKRMYASLEKNIKLLQTEIYSSKNRLFYLSPENKINSYKSSIESYKLRLNSSFCSYLNFKAGQVDTLKSKIKVMNPMNVLSRGYAVVTMEGKTITKAKDLCEGKRIRVILADGEIDCIVQRKE